MYTTAYLYRLFEERRKQLGLRQDEVGMLITGRPDTSVLQNLRRGAVPSIKRVSELCDALKMECYVGPKRKSGGEGKASPTNGARAQDR